MEKQHFSMPALILHTLRKTIIAQELHHRHCAFEQAGKLPPSHVRLAISSITESGGKSDCFHMTGFIENKNFQKSKQS